MQTQNRKLNFNQPMPIIEQQNQVIEVKKDDQTLTNFDEFNIEINGVEPAKIKTNLETIKEKLILQRDNLKIEVSEDSKVEAGKFRASVNKLAKNIKLEVEENLLPITKPIDEINKDVKEIGVICKEISTKIDLEIEKVNLEIRKNIIKFANKYLQEKYEFYKLGSEFQTINLAKMGDDLGHINSKNDDIKPSSKLEIERLVVEKKTLETNSINRLLILENECLKAGILPLLKDDVSSFLMESDEVYSQKLQSLILKTKEREEKIKAQAIERQKAESEAKTNAEISRIKAESEAKLEIQRAKMEADNQAKINAETIAKKQQEQEKTAEEVAKIEDKKPESDNEFYNFSVKFKIEKARLDASGTSFEQWSETLKTKLSECFKTFDGITCTKNEQSLSLDVQDDLRFLAALREAGVDNWNGYDAAFDIYNGRY